MAVDATDNQALIFDIQYSDDDGNNENEVTEPVSLDISFQFLSYSVGKGKVKLTFYFS